MLFFPPEMVQLILYPSADMGVEDCLALGGGLRRLKPVRKLVDNVRRELL
jgi:hypothetical protein